MDIQNMERLGFDIVSNSDSDYRIGIRQKWYWDCMMTKMTQVIVIRDVETLTLAIMDQDREYLEKQSSSLDPSRLPRGIQKGNAVLMLYKAKKITPEAKARCLRKPKIRFAFFYVPAVLDLSTGESHYITSTPTWGAIYYGKFRFLIRQMLSQNPVSESEPLSKIGIFFNLLFLVVIILNILLITM